YPGAALIEGTNVSEGRGTAKPFELIGAPFINANDLADKLNDAKLPGVIFRAAYFTPTFSKHEGELSGGIQIHVNDRESYQPIKTGITIVKAIHDMYAEDFEFLDDNFDRLIGNSWVREKNEQGKSVDEILSQWAYELQYMKSWRWNYLLYTITTAHIEAHLSQLAEDGEIKNTEALHDLERHLTAVRHYEEERSFDKAVKHM